MRICPGKLVLEGFSGIFFFSIFHLFGTLNLNPTISTAKITKLLDEVRSVMRLHHYSLHTERSYCDWIKRYVNYHRMQSRADLAGGEVKMEAYLTHLAVEGQAAPATQNQARNALLFLYQKVLKQELDGRIDAVRAVPKKTVPVVLSREEVASSA